MKTLSGLPSIILKICFLAIISFPCSSAHADYLEVRRSANIKAEPNRDSTNIEHVEPGINLHLLNGGNQVNGYYSVETVSQGLPGWIYRTLVRRHPGEIPEPAPEGEITNPLEDPTLSLTPEHRRYAERHLKLGKPQAVYERVRQGYVLAQDARLKIPLWVQYELSVNDLNGSASRTDDFRADTSIPFGARSELDDYSGSGFDRGHMAPAGDMTRSRKVMSDSFFLSNMSPQVGIGFNRQIWKNLEEAVRGWVAQRQTLTIITGPIFSVEDDHVSYEVIGPNKLAVPTHFFKIIVDTNSPDKVEALAFIMPNERLSGRHYSEFLTTIDEIEKATGLDFLSALPKVVQGEVESVKAESVW